MFDTMVLQRWIGVAKIEPLFYCGFIERAKSMSESGTEPNQRPRFIAGAVCPNCHAEDRMVVDANQDVRRCVACDFTDGRPSGNLELPPTRVTRAAARRLETTADAIKILDN